MNKYIKPELVITAIAQTDVITLSGITDKTLGTDVSFGKTTGTKLKLNS